MPGHTLCGWPFAYPPRQPHLCILLCSGSSSAPGSSLAPWPWHQTIPLPEAPWPMHGSTLPVRLCSSGLSFKSGPPS